MTQTAAPRSRLPYRHRHRLRALAALGASLLTLATLAGCAGWPKPPAPPAPQQAPEPPPPAPVPIPLPPPSPAPAPAPPPPAPPVGVVEMTSRAGEQALLAGLRAYEDGQYTEAETKLRVAIKAGLAAPKDRAAAQKTLAFIYCTSDREKACESAFRAARAADPGFRLNKAEAGHPLWGPAYRRVMGIK